MLMPVTHFLPILTKKKKHTHKYFYFLFGKRHFCVLLEGLKHHRWTPCPATSVHAGDGCCVMKKGCLGMLREYLKPLAWSCLLQCGMANRKHTKESLYWTHSDSQRYTKMDKDLKTGVDVQGVSSTLHIYIKSWFPPYALVRLSSVPYMCTDFWKNLPR